MKFSMVSLFFKFHEDPCINVGAQTGNMPCDITTFFNPKFVEPNLILDPKYF